MDAQEAIVANAGYHTRLLNTIAELEYVPVAKKNQSSYIKDLENQVSASQQRIIRLAEKTKKERKEHEALRDATTKRFAHKLLGKREKFEARESKEEREYVEALEREMTERDNLVNIQQLLDSAKSVMSDLQQKQMLYESAQAELQALYARVFDGPSEAFPEDDRLEYDLETVKRQYGEIQANLNAESRAAELLARAAKAMDLCQKNMQEALGYSRYDMWGGGTMADMMERNALRNAQSNAFQVEMLVDQAVRESPAVQPVGRVNIAQGSIVSDVFFDNIFTDMAFHNKIKQSAAQVLLANQRLKIEVDAARRRADAAGARLMRVAETLDARRRELDSFRRATFESYAAQNPPPPSYDVVTNNPSTLRFPEPGHHDGATLSHAPVTSDPPPFPTAHREPEREPAPIRSSSPGELDRMPEARPLEWGSRNPYALAMAEQTRRLSTD
ncbi:hypothetical protein JR316_0011019 [Psilocybe cubensis]|uniref:Uncharacterized protein n=2 Tax=Psilocybe cubensis TaxID=181762 RepID=A0A8H8CFU1_PSICU|nr:hypothetical protein JR316_0011019 [Psilocybe cubensis]KAH9477103.1 hypothetical protein JR316_0011019 [Psilocybe cubensis]